MKTETFESQDEVSVTSIVKFPPSPKIVYQTPSLELPQSPSLIKPSLLVADDASCELLYGKELIAIASVQASLDGGGGGVPTQISKFA